MLRNSEKLIGLPIQARDGQIGHVADFYFDDRSWVIRYLIVDTGGWLSSRKVLISPESLRQPDWQNKVLPVDLDKAQIENSPPIHIEKPVSRQNEIELSEYYGWGPYWTSLTLPAAPRPMPIYFGPLSPANGAERRNGQGVARYQDQQEDYDPHLRSVKEVIGYHIQARDDEVGHVETLVMDDESWSILYLVVDTRNWLPGKKVLVALEWVEKINWVEELVYIDLEKETIKNSPEYDPDLPLNREVEASLYDYYHRSVYWQ